MKRSVFLILIGVLLGGASVYYLMKPKELRSVSHTVGSNNPNTTIKERKQKTKLTRKNVFIDSSFTASNPLYKEETFTSQSIFARSDFQYKHSITAQISYFVNSQMPVFTLSYSYNWLLISASVAYSFQLQTIDCAVGVGAKFNF